MAGRSLPAQAGMDHRNFPHGALTGTIIGAFQETYDELGWGFSERVYCNALVIVLIDRGLRVSAEVPIRVEFRGRLIGRFFADMVVNETVLVEVKAASSLETYAQAQTLNYLKAAGGGVGLLVNFGRHRQHKRFIMGNGVDSLPNMRHPDPPRTRPPSE